MTELNYYQNKAKLINANEQTAKDNIANFS